MGEHKAAKAGRGAGKQQQPQAKMKASFSPGGPDREGRGSWEGALAVGPRAAWAPSPHSTPIPDSGGFLSPTWTMVELKLH